MSKKFKNSENCQCDGCSQSAEDCKCVDCGLCPGCCDNPSQCGCACEENSCGDCTISNCNNKKPKSNKVYQFTKKDKAGQIRNAGRMEIKNQTTTNAELYFYGDIVGSSWESYWTDEDMCPQDVQNFLKQLEENQNIDIYINSGGGDVFGGIAIYNMLKRNSAFKTVHVDALAASIASVIALAGDKIIIPSTAQFMIHNPWCYVWGAYDSKSCRQLADALDACGKSILNVYQENLKDGVDINTIQDLMDNETWMTGEEAVEYFNIQIEETASMSACANSEFFNRYKHTPKNLIKKTQEKAKNTQNDNKELTEKLDKVLDALNKLVVEPKNEPEPQKNDEEIKKLKAKLALECEL